MILSAFCETSGVLQTFYYINMIVKALCYIVPAILVLMVTIDMIKNVIAGDEDKIKKNLRTIIKRMSFAVMVFFVPILVNFAFGLLGDLNVSAAKCYENATLDKIEYYKEKEEKEYADYQEQRKAEIEAIRKEQQDAVRKAMEAAASSSGGAAAITKVAFETAWGTNQKSTSRSKPTDTFKKYLNKYYTFYLNPTHKNVLISIQKAQTLLKASIEKLIILFISSYIPTLLT